MLSAVEQYHIEMRMYRRSRILGSIVLYGFILLLWLGMGVVFVHGMGSLNDLDKVLHEMSDEKR